MENSKNLVISVEEKVEHKTSEHHTHRDDVASKMGMWIFLFTEMLLFGGLFLLYLAYRIEYSKEFVIAAKELNLFMGATNTIILLTSSLTMALSIAALQRGKKLLSLSLIGATILFAFAFMVIKYFEWSAKFHHGIIPGSSTLTAKPNGQIMFYGLYFSMTGLHALHVIIGVTILIFMFVFVSRNSVNKDNFAKLENSGLYWHLVDLIWIFLFPLFYLLH
ncbi:MAG: cytochrome c oxidase subunit 3 family protein [Candidatus Kapaibacteriota bacterium]